MEARPQVIRPYGDTSDDGMVQVSFTLPLPHDRRAEAAARQLAVKMGVDPPLVAHARAVGEAHTFFLIYGPAAHQVDLATVEVTEREFAMLNPREINTTIRRTLRRKLSVVGACVGTDAHTVGIDAILNLKGVAGEKGLEYYRELKATNLGAQVPVPDLIRAAQAE